MDVVINVIDEDPCVANVLAILLESHGYLIRTHSSVDALLEDLTQQPRSISLVSFGLPRRGASRFLESIRNHKLPTLAVMMSGGVDTSHIVEAMKVGAEDVIEKPLSINELLAVIERSVLKVNSQQPTAPSRAVEWFESLTEEEQAIFELMEQGVTIKQIAARLDVSIRTVHYRKKSILKKTDSTNRTEAVAKLSSIRSTLTPTAC